MKRAGTDEQKGQRRQQIVDRAAQLLAVRDFDELKLSDLAEELHLVKGTLYRYFPTKEALVLEVLETELEGWLKELARALSPQPVTSLELLSELLATSLAERPLLIKLFSIVHVQLEKHLTLERLVEFKQRTARALSLAATLLETAWPPLNSRGAEAVLGLYELAIGVGHLTSSSAVVKQALLTPGLEVFRLTFQGQLAKSLRWLLRGILATTEAGVG